jgi:hypothetical protein
MVFLAALIIRFIAKSKRGKTKGRANAADG